MYDIIHAIQTLVNSNLVEQSFHLIRRQALVIQGEKGLD